MDRVLRSLQKNVAFFMFFAKERCVLFCSLEKKGKERNVLMGLISRQKLKKTDKNGTFFERSEKIGTF